MQLRFGTGVISPHIDQTIFDLSQQLRGHVAMKCQIILLVKQRR
jgi:hypothetical protein